MYFKGKCHHLETIIASLQSRHDFGKQMLSIFSAKIIPAIFDFNGSGRLGRERKLHQGGVQQSKLRRGMGIGE